MIPLFKVFMAEEALKLLSKTLYSGYIGEGPEVQRFEQRFGEYVKNPDIVMVNSGTSAITMALRLAGVGMGDYVITTPMTCLATNMPILSLGAIPVWCDILSDGTIDPKWVELHLKSLKSKVKAVICMDWGGKPCLLDELTLLCRQYGIPLIEDACQSIGSEYNGRPVGKDADFVCWSFQAIKHLTTGDGGCLAVNDRPDLLEQARLMKWFGLDRTKSESLRCGQNPPIWGYKFQMNDIAASIGLANLDHLPWIVNRTKLHAKKYNKRLEGAKNIDFLPFTYDKFSRSSGYWLYTVYVGNPSHFSNYMKENGVTASKVHDRNDNKSVFPKNYLSFPVVDNFDSHHVCIPVGWWLTEEEQEKVIQLCLNY